MQLETREGQQSEPMVGVPATRERRRVRNDAWHLKRTARQRRIRANAMVFGSLLVVLALVRVFYALLTK